MAILGALVLALASTASADPVSLDAADWDYVAAAYLGQGPVETTVDGLKAWGEGYRSGTMLQSDQYYDFRDSQTLVKWMVNSAGHYTEVGVSLANVQANSAATLHNSRWFTTHHSYLGSMIVEDNVWYYSRWDIDAAGAYQSVTCTNDWDLNGGTPFNTAWGNWAPSNAGIFCLYIGDNYGGSSAWVLLGEAYATAAAVPEPATLSLLLLGWLPVARRAK